MLMRLLVTADLHYNHPRSRKLAESLIEQMNHAGGDVLLVVGDTAASDSDAMEQCLSRFRFPGPKLFVAGNHELWTHGPDSYEIIQQTLPSRIRAMGWHWLQTEPFVAAEVAIVGNIGWYDYSFAPPDLEITRRFYEAKISPGAAEYLGQPLGEVSERARQVVARWNDGKFVKLHRTDDAFLEELLGLLKSQLDSLREIPHVVAAVHHIPLPELLPPRRYPQLDFARAYLGSPKIGQLIRQYPNVRTLLCGHSHFPAETQVDQIHAINIGSGYRAKAFRELNVIAGLR